MFTASDEIDRDHVPARAIFPKSLRPGLNLKRIESHAHCNRAYALDEQYFLSELGPLAFEDPVGAALAEDLRRAYQHPEQRRLGQAVARAFSKLELPHGLVAKTYNHARVARVVWKIVRGLHTREICHYLPEDLPRDVQLFEPEALLKNIKNLNALWGPVIGAKKTMGDYPRIFDYSVVGLRFEAEPEGGGFMTGQAWLMMFWNRVIIGVLFHNPDCQCVRCQDRRERAQR